MSTDSVTNQVFYNTISVFFRVSSNGIADIMQMITGSRKLDTLEKALSGSLYQKLRVIRDLTDAMRSRCIGLIPFVNYAGIQTHNISIE